MAHKHEHADGPGHKGHHHHHHGGGEGNLRAAFFLNLAFTVIEFIGGILTNSVAILSDAIHDLGDSLALGLAWYFERLSKRGSSPSHTYGYQRYSLLGGLITGTVLIAGLVAVLWQTIPRLLHPEPVHAGGMLGLAVVGILFNGVAVLRMRGDSSLTSRIVSWHLLEDVLGWVAVLIGATAMAIWDVPIIDPLLSVGLACFILWNVFRNLRGVFEVFLQNAPRGFDVRRFEREVQDLPRVTSTHHTHVWSIDGEHHVLSTHIVMEACTTRDEVLAVKRAVREMLDEHQFQYLTLDIELADEPCVAEVRES